MKHRSYCYKSKGGFCTNCGNKKFSHISSKLCIMLAAVTIISVCLTACGSDKLSDKETQGDTDVAYIENTVDVTDELTNIYDEDDSFENKYNQANNKLRELEKNNKIKNISYSEDAALFSFEYTSGAEGFFLLDSAYDKESWFGADGISRDNDGKSGDINYSLLTEANEKENSKWLFLFCSNSKDLEEKQNFDYINAQYDQYKNMGINVDLVTDYTVSDFMNLKGYGLIYIMGHGFLDGNGNPHIFTSEKPTADNISRYSINLFIKKDVVIVSENGSSSYVIKPSFFENYYEEDDLKDAIILNSCCCLFGNAGSENYDFQSSYCKAGAGTVIGFTNTVKNVYSNLLYEYILMNLSKGDSIGDAYDSACDIIGKNEVEYYNLASAPVISYGIPVIVGKRDTKIINHDNILSNGIGRCSFVVRDNETNKGIDLASVTIFDIDYDEHEIYRFFFTDQDGVVSFDLPEGKYYCKIEKNGYELHKMDIYIKAGVDTVFLDDVVLNAEIDPTVKKYQGMSSDELALQVFAPAEHIFESFCGLGGFFESKVDYNHMDEYLGDYVYPLEEKYTLDDVKKEICKYFTSKMAEDLIDGVFVERDGRVYASIGMSSRGSNISYAYTIYSVNGYSNEREELTFKLVHLYLKDEYYDAFWDLMDEFYDTHDYSDESKLIFNKTIPEEYLYEEIEYCTMVKEDGIWVFSDFDIGY